MNIFRATLTTGRRSPAFLSFCETLLSSNNCIDNAGQRNETPNPPPALDPPTPHGGWRGSGDIFSVFVFRPSLIKQDLTALLSLNYPKKTKTEDDIAILNLNTTSNRFDLVKDEHFMSAAGRRTRSARPLRPTSKTPPWTAPEVTIVAATSALT
ncbi:hypothetical protein EVAR_97071_1 [Eumeta japonica]|uniref:Uncharacterized protein n=1 Tax=Eumeta variegata TaxID=151549 RepID=A0A4C1X4L2_EUMVA|nr:hypothetical protein EVAR_97071_1 [Eumeta japonica]